MSDAIFRTAVEPVDVSETATEASSKPQEPITTGGETKVPELLATYQDDQGKPYVAKYLELENMWNKEPHLKNEINTIEGYLREQVKKGKLENSTKAADKYLRELEKKAEANRYESTPQRIQKLLAYIEFRSVIDE